MKNHLQQNLQYYMKNNGFLLIELLTTMAVVVMFITLFARYQVLQASIVKNIEGRMKLLDLAATCVERIVSEKFIPNSLVSPVPTVQFLCKTTQHELPVIPHMMRSNTAARFFMTVTVIAQSFESYLSFTTGIISRENAT